jgi:hypothetical protein
VDTSEKKEEFVQLYLEKEGIHIDPAKMILNKGLRAIA